MPVAVFISFARGDDHHAEQVRLFANFLRAHGIDVTADFAAAEQPQDWPVWMSYEMSRAAFVLVAVSATYRGVAERPVSGQHHRGVEWEIAHIRNGFYGDRSAALRRYLAVILPGTSIDDIPTWMGPPSATHYVVSDYTVGGCEKLLRLLTNQPYETPGSIGPVPTLTPRRIDTSDAGYLRHIRAQLVDRAYTSNLPLLRAAIRQLLLSQDLGLYEYQIVTSMPPPIDGQQHRLEVDVAHTTIDIRPDLRRPTVLQAAEIALQSSLAPRGDNLGQRRIGILTDGVDWRVYLSCHGRFQHAASLRTAAEGADALMSWLEAILATGGPIEPTPAEITRRLGASSPSYKLDFIELSALYDENRRHATVQLKRTLWAKLLRTAQGTHFSDSDNLFINHTLLVAMAKVIGHFVIGIPPTDPDLSATAIMTGARLSEVQLGGVIEADFFDWLVHTPRGDEYVQSLIRKLSRFRWSEVTHDVMKVLYESIISRETRHQLGEYYTPDWLARRIIAACVTDPLNQTVLDASCGSGTFLFHSVRHYLAAAQSSGMPDLEALRGVVQRVLGVDVHPVAATLARVTYLLAIGTHRLTSGSRPPLSIPVYLGDSLRWGEERTLLSYPGLPVSTTPNDDLYEASGDPGDQLLFPRQVIAHARFDELVNELADRATRRARRSPVPSVSGTLKRFAITGDDARVLRDTFGKMCALHDEYRDHIWGYYVRNLSRPEWLAENSNRVDVLVGNPPWLAYRYMTQTQQRSFKAMSTARGLWRGGRVATQQELAALFVVRCIERYLRTDRRFGYVMPRAVLSRKQYQGFREGVFSLSDEPFHVAFDQPWDMHQVKPRPFPVPAAVILGTRRSSKERAAALPPANVWPVRVPDNVGAPGRPRARSDSALLATLPVGPVSLYASRFANGATVYPRLLFVVEPDDGAHWRPAWPQRAVRSRRSRNEKRPWKDVDKPLRGAVEEQFIRPLLIGASVLPFRCLAPVEAVIPWDEGGPLPASDDALELYPGVEGWWRQAEALWNQYPSKAGLSLLGRLDFNHALSRQFPIAANRVVYGKSGMYMAAAVVSDTSIVIDHELYWAAVPTVDEARFVAAILNSSPLTAAVRPRQARGEHNPRHFDKYVFELPIPLYDAERGDHRDLATLAVRAEAVATQVDLPAVRFERQRRCIREALVEDGVAREMDTLVSRLLEQT